MHNSEQMSGSGLRKTSRPFQQRFLYGIELLLELVHGRFARVNEQSKGASDDKHEGEEGTQGILETRFTLDATCFALFLLARWQWRQGRRWRRVRWCSVRPIQFGQATNVQCEIAGSWFTWDAPRVSFLCTPSDGATNGQDETHAASCVKSSFVVLWSEDGVRDPFWPVSHWMRFTPSLS